MNRFCMLTLAIAMVLAGVPHLFCACADTAGEAFVRPVPKCPHCPAGESSPRPPCESCQCGMCIRIEAISTNSLAAVGDESRSLELPPLAVDAEYGSIELLTPRSPLPHRAFPTPRYRCALPILLGHLLF